MKDELNVLTTNNSWILTTLPLGNSIIGCRWIYKIKYHSDATTHETT